jgi:hypothetical protein
MNRYWDIARVFWTTKKRGVCVCVCVCEREREREREKERRGEERSTYPSLKVTFMAVSFLFCVHCLGLSKSEEQIPMPGQIHL